MRTNANGCVIEGIQFQCCVKNVSAHRFWHLSTASRERFSLLSHILFYFPFCAIIICAECSNCVLRIEFVLHFVQKYGRINRAEERKCSDSVAIGLEKFVIGLIGTRDNR